MNGVVLPADTSKVFGYTDYLISTLFTQVNASLPLTLR
ncbi:hypothetical protein MA4S0303_3104 [Mycobacteroides abscessus 4S-0303]|nr:hypothetical protein MA4S0303_3104 [Mycobacteroides abscessus 4S-0303]